MRFDTPIYFQRITPGAYNHQTGNYGPDTVQETTAFASVTDTGTSMLNLVYGKIKQGVLTVRIRGHYTAAFDYIRIGSTRYAVDFRRTRLPQIDTFIVSEVQ